MNLLMKQESIIYGEDSMGKSIEDGKNILFSKKDKQYKTFYIDIYCILFKCIYCAGDAVQWYSACHPCTRLWVKSSTPKAKQRIFSQCRSWWLDCFPVSSMSISVLDKCRCTQTASIWLERKRDAHSFTRKKYRNCAQNWTS